MFSWLSDQHGYTLHAQIDDRRIDFLIDLSRFWLISKQRTCYFSY